MNNQRPKKPLKAAPEKPLTPKQLERRIKEENDSYLSTLKQIRRKVLTALSYPDNPIKLPPNAIEKGVTVPEMTSAFIEGNYKRYTQDLVQTTMDDLAILGILEKTGTPPEMEMKFRAVYGVPEGIRIPFFLGQYPRYRLSVPVEPVTETQILQFLLDKSGQLRDQLKACEDSRDVDGECGDYRLDNPLYRLLDLFLDILLDHEWLDYTFFVKWNQWREECSAKEVAEAAKGAASTITEQKVS